jgi:hypothetical protein
MFGPKLGASIARHVSPANRPNKTGYRGVSKEKCKKRPYKTTIKKNGRSIYLGHHKTAKEAAKAYDEAALKIYGKFAVLNFPKKKGVR